MPNSHKTSAFQKMLSPPWTANIGITQASQPIEQMNMNVNQEMSLPSTTAKHVPVDLFYAIVHRFYLGNVIVPTRTIDLSNHLIKTSD